MFITYIAQWLYTVMQLPVPIVLSPTHIYSITIFNLFIGVLLFGIFMLLLERAMHGLRYSDFRIKEKVPQTTDNANKKVSEDLSKGYRQNIGVKLVKGKDDE